MAGSTANIRNVTARRANLCLIGIAVLFGLVIVAAYLLVTSAKKPAPVPRQHIYYCLHEDSGHFLPCMYRKNDPINV